MLVANTDTIIGSIDCAGKLQEGVNRRCVDEEMREAVDPIAEDEALLARRHNSDSRH